jgi:hypothetical protein
LPPPRLSRMPLKPLLLPHVIYIIYMYPHFFFKSQGTRFFPLAKCLSDHLPFFHSIHCLPRFICNKSKTVSIPCEITHNPLDQRAVPGCITLLTKS